MHPRFSALLAVCPLCFPLFAAAAEPIPGIGPTGDIDRLHTGFHFTEGPAVDRDGNLFFSDIPANTIYRRGTDGTLIAFTDNSRHANGLMFNAHGMLVACEMDGQIASWDTETKTRQVLADGYQGKRFNAPNDLVIDSQGGIYFTDPHFRAPQPLPQGTMGVYYLADDGTVRRVASDLPAPNGILLSVDEQTLYVLPSGDSAMRAYAVTAPGELGADREFCQLRGSSGMAGADGAALDTNSNLYITSGSGVQVVSPGGNVLGVIELPETPANVTFGGSDRKTLYATARTSLYAIPLEATGHRYPATQNAD